MNHQRLCNREPSPSQEEIFYSMLKMFPRYPFCEGKDKKAFGYFFKLYPQVDLVPLLERQFDFWKKNPEALKSKKNPREQLKNFLLKEIWDPLKVSILKAIEQESNKG